MSTTKLFEFSSARAWGECYPIGNGNIGVMDNGSLNKQKIYYNDDRLWSGCDAYKGRKCAPEILEKIRAAVVAEDFGTAEKLLVQNINGEFTQSYMPLSLLSVSSNLKHCNNYSRTLDMAEGIHFVKSDVSDITEFVSMPSKCHVMEYEVKQDAKFEFVLSSQIRSNIAYKKTNYGAEITLLGVAPTHCDPIYHQTNNAVVYSETDAGSKAAMVITIRTDGVIGVESGAIIINNPKKINVIAVTEVQLNPTIDLLAVARDRAEKLITIEFGSLQQQHIADYKPLFDRVSLDLCDASRNQTTSDLIKTKPNKRDNSLYVQLYNFGRYLMIASSRVGTAAANLQGIWNHLFKAPWSSNYTININTQMNYWGVETANLSEMHEPLFDLIEKIRIKGEKVAKDTYHCRGWVSGHNSDIWGHANHVGIDSPGSTCYALCISSNGWLCQHIFEHYLFTADKEFLKSKLDTMIGAAEFLLDYMSIDNATGKLITNPSASPENKFRHGGGSYAVNKCSTMDLAIINELFKNVLQALADLGIKHAIEAELRDALAQLLPYQIDSNGRLQEWYGEYKETSKHHRHVSHLYGLYPGREFNYIDTPELVEAARKSLTRRGLGGTGWAKAWKIGLYARLHDGETALEEIDSQLRYVSAAKKMSLSGGTYQSLLCAHPPFQIDGNFGAMASIAEMLLQSHNGFLELLPALPAKWSSGSVKGLCARGGYVVDIEWKDCKIIALNINSKIAKTVKIRENGAIAEYPIPYKR